MKAYFDSIYNPVYDFTTARLNRYRKLQERCVGKLEIEDDDRVLCVGVGTGNEILHILKTNRNVDIVGVDYSHTALRKAHKKALVLGKEIEGLIMDARYLEFAAGSFNKVLCIHVMDFVEENEKVTDEILRVLKDGGQFVITYPSEKEGPKLGFNLLRDKIFNRHESEKWSIKALLECIAQFVVSTVYLPLLLRPKKQSYSLYELTSMMSKLTNGDFQIEEDAVYQDFVICGRK